MVELDRTAIDPGQRDVDRVILEAYREVLPTCAISELPASPEKPGLRSWSLAGRKRTWVVGIMTDWSTVPKCSCKDTAHSFCVKREAFCSHIIAVLLTRNDLRYQLLALFL